MPEKRSFTFTMPILYKGWRKPFHSVIFNLSLLRKGRIGVTSGCTSLARIKTSGSSPRTLQPLKLGHTSCRTFSKPHTCRPCYRSRERSSGRISTKTTYCPVSIL
ncbi:unnamed protein product [Amoebophrya sp. A120]|nr:unnamed protein product [Amoebophrya sp. A120]|eukprot:GSA120T00008733001.1